MSNEHPQKFAPRAGVFGALLLLSAVMVGVGVMLVVRQDNWSMLAAGCVSMIGVLAVWQLSSRLATVDFGLVLEERITPVLEKVERISTTLDVMADQQLISDRAKSVAFREKDRDAFRRAIHEDMAKQDFEAALTLVEDMDRNFGYRAEAQRLRQEILQRRDEAIRRQLDTAISVVDRHVQNEQWQAAFKEAERLRAVFPTQPAVQTLMRDIEQRRASMKNELLVRWKEHCQRKQVDEAISVLKKLDSYLNPDEAHLLEEEARMVFKEKLARLREQFASAVQGHRWAEALRHGDAIINDFPNSQMAKEVSESMTALRERMEEEQSEPAVV